MALAIAFEQSSGLLLEAGAREVWASIEALTDRIAEGVARLGFEVVSPRGPGEKSGILAFRDEAIDPDACVAALAERGITIVARRGYLRAAPHFYNRPEQVDALISALGEFKSSR